LIVLVFNVRIYWLFDYLLSHNDFCTVLYFHQYLPSWVKFGRCLKYLLKTQLFWYRYWFSHTFNGLFSRTTWVIWHQKGKSFWILLKQALMGGSGISWTIRKSFAPHSRQITIPVPHHSIFYGSDALPDAQTTVSKHWRQSIDTDCHVK